MPGMMKRPMYKNGKKVLKPVLQELYHFFYYPQYLLILYQLALYIQVLDKFVL